MTACVATAQNNDRGFPAPTIHKPASAIPLPALPVSNSPAPNYSPNAAWVGSPSGPSNVMQASYTAPVVNTTPVDQPVAKRTPLNSKKTEASLADGKSSAGNTLKMMFSVGSSLLIVIGLFLGVAWCYRKTLSTSLGGIPKQVVSVLGRTAIAPRQQLILVRFGSKLVLVSMNQGEARTISEITDPLEVDQLAGTCESHQPHSLTNSFRNILNQNSGGAV
jgi:flagellar biogenesis protein FliO